MMKDKKTLTVSILGRSYSLLTDEENVIVEEAAQMIESSLKKMGGTMTSPADLVKKTTFVALTVAVDLIKRERDLQVASDKTATLNDLLKDSTNSA